MAHYGSNLLRSPTSTITVIGLRSRKITSGHGLADLGQADEVDQVGVVFDGRVVELEDHVAGLQLGGLGGRVRA